MASLATVVLSGCNFTADDSVTDFMNNGKFHPDAAHRDYLSRISETFLPLGGRQVNLEDQGQFILKMINDCRSPQEREQFVQGFQQYKEVMEKSRLQTESAQPEEVLQVVERTLQNENSDEDLLYFIATVKELSLFNLKNSEQYMTGYLEYSLIPPKYDPCAEL